MTKLEELKAARDAYVARDAVYDAYYAVRDSDARDAFADNQELPKITRVEVIGNDGRLLVKYVKNARISMQDDYSTLKIFLEE